jgi:hypothetical protein
MVRRAHTHALAAVLLGAALAGCGGGGGKSASSTPRALSAEANAAATGDIPDNQVFLTLVNRLGGYSIKYPEGWTQRGGGADLTLADKNNLVHITVGRGSLPSPAEVGTQLARLRRTTPSLAAHPPAAVTINGRPAVKVTYTTESAANPVTGKRVVLMVDRYVLARGGRRAVIDLGTPTGVDNVDAYRMMIESFRWR